METPTSWPNNVGRSPGAGPPRTVAAAAALVGVLVAGSLVTAALGQGVNTTVLLARHSQWRYYDGAMGPSGWSSLAFVDTSWKRGPGPLGFGSPVVNTSIACVRLTS